MSSVYALLGLQSASRCEVFACIAPVHVYGSENQACIAPRGNSSESVWGGCVWACVCMCMYALSLCEVSVACMLSFSYEDSFNVYHFIAQVAY